MSINRSTQAYKKRVKAFAKALRWPGYRKGENGRHVERTVDEVIAEHAAGAPRYLTEDALVLLITDSRSSADYSERSAREDRELAEEMERRLTELRRPKPRLVGGREA